MPDAGYSEDLSTSNEAPPEWKGEIEHTFLGYEHNPFTGKPFFNEVRTGKALPQPPALQTHLATSVIRCMKGCCLDGGIDCEPHFCVLWLDLHMADSLVQPRAVAKGAACTPFWM